jgi:DNA-binding GntR family transcriptional regulator
VEYAKIYRPNLSDVAYDEIKEMILFGELDQGERIYLNDMSQRLNLSITPIREALNKLAQEDLITSTPRTSYEVISMNSNDIKDVMELRILLETYSLKTANDALSTFPVMSFRKLFKKSYSIRNFKDFIKADVKFHNTIIKTSKNKKLEKLHFYIFNFIRILQVPAAKIEGRMERANREHLAILDAIEAQDLDLALSQLKSHLESVKEILLGAYRRKDNSEITKDL